MKIQWLCRLVLSFHVTNSQLHCRSPDPDDHCSWSYWCFIFFSCFSVSSIYLLSLPISWPALTFGNRAKKNHFAQYSNLAHESIAHCLCSYRLWWKLRIYHGLEIRMCLCSLCKALACPLLWPYQMVFLPRPKMSCNFSFIQRWLAVRHMYTLYRIPCSVPRISRLFLHWFPLGQHQPFTI